MEQLTVFISLAHHHVIDLGDAHASHGKHFYPHDRACHSASCLASEAIPHQQIAHLNGHSQTCHDDFQVFLSAQQYQEEKHASCITQSEKQVSYLIWFFSELLVHYLVTLSWGLLFFLRQWICPPYVILFSSRLPPDTLAALVGASWHTDARVFMVEVYLDGLGGTPRCPMAAWGVGLVSRLVDGRCSCLGYLGARVVASFVDFAYARGRCTVFILGGCIVGNAILWIYALGWRDSSFVLL